MRWLKWGLWGLGGLLGLALLVVAAWVLSNIGDADPVPVPERLRLEASKLAPERNAFFLLQQLMAPAGVDAVAAGRASWQEMQAQNRLTREEMQALFAPRVEQVQAHPAEDPAAGEPAASMRLRAPDAAPWLCLGPDCAAQQLADVARLGEQRVAAAAWGQRCDLIVDQDLGYEEQVHDPIKVHSPVPVFAPLLDCARWFAADALLAFSGGDVIATEKALRRGAVFSVRVTEGSRTLIGHLIALRVQQVHLATTAALAVRDQKLARMIAPLLAEPLHLRHAAQRALIVESAFSRAAVVDMRAACKHPFVEVDHGSLADAGWFRTLPMRVQHLLCRHGIGTHPERTRQVADARWLELIDATGAGWEEGVAAGAKTHDTGLHWRNTVGMRVFGGGSGMFSGYIARFADAELHHQAVALAVQAAAQGVGAPDRAAWLAQQPVPPAQRARLSFEADGHALLARSHGQDIGGGNWKPERDAIRILWPS